MTTVIAPRDRTAPATGTPARTAEAVVTGIGVAAPNGLGTEAWWAATLRGESGIRPLTRFDAGGYPVKLAGEVPGFVDADHVSSRLLPQTDRVTRLSLAAAKEALDDAGADPARLPDHAAGVVTANSFGGFEFGQRELEALWSKGGGMSRRTSPSRGSTRSTAARSPSGTDCAEPPG